MDGFVAIQYSIDEHCGYLPETKCDIALDVRFEFKMVPEVDTVKGPSFGLELRFLPTCGFDGFLVVKMGLGDIEEKDGMRDGTCKSFPRFGNGDAELPSLIEKLICGVSGC